MKSFIRASVPAVAGLVLTASLYGPPPPGKGPNRGGDDGGTQVDHRALQTDEIKLGTSGGWQFDLANGYCCGGTLGALIEFDGKKHILSNFHVLAADVVPGGNGVTAQLDDPVIHPALIDTNCGSSAYRDVASLSGVANPLLGSNIDAATAEILPGAVDLSGAILQIGQISNQTVAASVGQAVKKSGRTTGFTRSTVAYLDVNVEVAYDDECAGVEIGVGLFEGQIVVDNSGSSFLAGGDSGSLLVEDKADRPRAIGLLFAGSSTHAIANPIDDVLGFFNATMVGLDGTGSEEDSSGGGGNGRGNGGKKNRGNAAEIAKAMAANKKAEALARRVAKGVGHGVGVDDSGKPYVAIFVETLEGEASDISEIDGVPVRLVETGRFVAF
ncbi:hypothetical protein [Pelagicoccus mobilis]|uniref:Nal1 C-terminal domain-containing protein n=1 Tax=Pelagicoccus mobilis TaxID=415221 RepID=A0A934RZP1_9BACT|nr:hypothetical protein [Pelagicoccus mobilis]MBK1876789.1 hypothetical protein [Pelagicoccus mobilis]